MANVSAVSNSSYTCANTRQSGALNEIYACYATISSQSTLTISSTSFGDSIRVGGIVMTVTSGQIVFANGIAIARAGTDPAWTTSSGTPLITPTTTPESVIPSSTTSQFVVATGSANTRLSDGVKAGIGIAAAVGGLLFIGFGYLVSRWRYQKRATHKGGGAATVTSAEMHVHGKPELDSGQAGQISLPVYEMPTGGR